MADSDLRLESFDERTASSEWRGHGWYEHKNAASNKNGVPDRYYARPGFQFFVEWKRIGEPLGDQQSQRVEHLRRMGVNVLAPCHTRNQFWRYVRDNAPQI